MKRLLSIGSLLVANFFLPLVASAHAFGQQYTLPLPQSLYITGGICALLASFAILALYNTPQPDIVLHEHVYPLRPKFLPKLLSGLGIFFLFFTIIAGAFGSQLLYANPAPLLFWIVLLLYITYANALVGGLWNFSNPFKNICAWAFEGVQPLLSYPQRLGYMPALILYYLLIWVELFSNGAGANALFLSIGLQCYFALCLIGSFLFGTESWFRYGDFFSVFFNLIGRAAPLQLQNNTVTAMPPGERLVNERAERFSLLIFILFMLSSTAFDGLRDTSAWVNAILSLPLALSDYFVLLSEIALLLSPFLFCGLYLIAIWLTKLVIRNTQSVKTLALRFAFSLIPIAIVYNFAHYFGLLYSDAQYLIPIASDPFGLGWNLFGTSGYSPNLSIIAPQTVWYIQFGAVVAGHIFAAYTAHRIALREFITRREVLLGQVPMMLLMVFYAALGLWILSAPYAAGAL